MSERWDLQPDYYLVYVMLSLIIWSQQLKCIMFLYSLMYLYAVPVRDTLRHALVDEKLQPPMLSGN